MGIEELRSLLGIKLMPRIRNWQDYKFFRPSTDATYEYIKPLFKEVVDWKLIRIHWQDLMRVVLSIKAGKLIPSTILRKLGSHSRKNRLYQAFRELGQVIRTIFYCNISLTNLYDSRSRLVPTSSRATIDSSIGCSLASRA